jgi:hypothetical protein
VVFEGHVDLTAGLDLLRIVTEGLSFALLSSAAQTVNAFYRNRLPNARVAVLHGRPRRLHTCESYYQWE